MAASDIGREATLWCADLLDRLATAMAQRALSRGDAVSLRRWTEVTVECERLKSEGGGDGER